MGSGDEKKEEEVENPVSKLQDMINKRLAEVEALKGVITVTLAANTAYDGDVTLYGGTREVADNFALELVAEDAGEDGMQGDGYTTVNGDIVIRGIKVIMKSIMMASDKMIVVENDMYNNDRGGTLDFYGTANAMNEIAVDIGLNSAARIKMGDDDDTVKLTTYSGAGKADIDMGGGINNVSAVVSGGDISVVTGILNDTVTLNIQEGAGTIKADTGEDNDTLKITDNGGEGITVNTGGGDDEVSVDMRAGAVDMTLNTGGGSDQIEVYKGDHYTSETVEYEQSQEKFEIMNDNAVSVLTIKNEDKTAMDRIIADADLSDAIRGIRLDSANGAGVHFRGSLSKDADPISSLALSDGSKKLTLKGENNHTLELWYSDKDFLTDELRNKNTQYLTASGDSYTYTGTLKDFTDYVFRTPVSGLKTINISAASPLTLTNVVLDPEESMDTGDKITVNDLTAKNINVLLRGKETEFKGKVEARNIWAYMLQGTRTVYEDFGKGNLSNVKGDLISAIDDAKITVDENAHIIADQDIVLRSRVKHYGNMITALAAFLNVLNLKIATASVDIQGVLEAKKGSVEAKSSILTTVGVERTKQEDGTYKESNGGMPVAVTWVMDDAAVTVGEKALVEAGSDILLNSESKIKTVTYADSSTVALPLVPLNIAFTFIKNQVTTEAAGTLNAGRKVLVKAVGDIEDRNEASRSKTTTALNTMSGYYAAINVADQDVQAVIKSTAKVTAKKGMVEVYSRARADVTNNALAAAGKVMGKGNWSNTVGAVMKLVSAFGDFVVAKTNEYLDVSPRLKKFLDSAGKKIKKVFGVEDDQASNLKVSVISPAESNKKGNASVTTTGEGSKITAQVNVQPKAGCTVKSVKYRYLRPAESKYTTNVVQKNAEGQYVFTVPSNNTEVLVEYEGEPAEDDAAVNNEDNNGNNQAGGNDEDLNIGNLLDDAAQGGENAEEEEELYSVYEPEDPDAYCLLDLQESLSGSIVTWLENPERESHSLRKIYPGQNVLLIPNPASGKKLSVMTVSYDTRNDKGKTVRKTEVIAPDEKGRYIFTVPENAERQAHYEVNGSYVKEEAKPADTEKQITGTVAFSLLDNDGSAVVEKGSTVEAGDTLKMFSMRQTNGIDTADASSITQNYGLEDGDEELQQISQYKWDVSGAQYALRITGTDGGKVECTNHDKATNWPTFKVTPDAGYKVDRVYMSFYSKNNISPYKGRRTTEELKQNEKGEWVAALTGVAIEEGSTVDVNVIFVREDGKETDGSATHVNQQYVVRNPIRVRWNALSRDLGNDKTETVSIGEVYFENVWSKDGKYYFRVDPNTKLGYNAKLKLDDTSVLYASYQDAAGITHKMPLLHDEHGWYYGLENDPVPAGAIVTINVEFQEELHDLKQSDDTKNGSVSFDKEQAKASDTVTATLNPETDYFASKVIVSWYTRGAITEKQTKEYTPDENGKVRVEVPEMAETSSLTFTPVFFKKDIFLKAEGTAEESTSDKNVKITTGEKAYKGQTVQVAPSEELAKKGYKVGEIEISYYTADGEEKTVVFENVSSFKVPEDVRIQGTANLQIKAKMKLKTILIPSSGDENGTIRPAESYADPGDTVIVNIEPESGYKIKNGTLKAEISTGNEARQIVLDRIGPNKYSFTMPENADKDTQIDLVGKFVPGNDDDSYSVGVGIAINVTRGANTLEIRGGSTTASGLQMNAINSGKAFTTAKAGFNAGNTAAGGALAIHISNTKNYNNIKADKDGSLTVNGGDIFMLAKGKVQFVGTADASGKKNTKGENIGVGAGILFSVGNNETSSEIEDGVNLTKDSEIRSVTMNIGTKLKDIQSAKAGAVGGTSYVPVAAVDIVSVSSKAKLGKIKEGMLKIPGKVNIKSSAESARVEYNHKITADASAQGGDTAMGGAFGVAWINNRSEAILNQSVDAKSVTLKSTGGDAVKINAKAAAAGGVQTKKNKNKEGGADKQANNLLKAGAKLGARTGSKNLDPNRIGNDADNRQKAETPEQTLGLAASMVLNVQRNISRARVEDGVDVTAENEISVRSYNRTAAEIKADSSTTKTEKGIGVGLAINVVNGENIAYIGNGTITGKSVEVIADIAKVPANVGTWPEVRDEGGFTTAFKARVKKWINDWLASEKLTFLGDLGGTLAGEFVNEFIKDTELKNLLDLSADGGVEGRFKAAYDMMAWYIEQAANDMLNPFLTLYEEVSQVVDMSREDWDKLGMDLRYEITAQLPGIAAQQARETVMKNKDKLISLILGRDAKMVGAGLEASAGDVLKDVAKEILKNIGLTLWNDFVTRMTIDFPMLSESNVAYLKSLYKEGIENVPSKVFDDFADHMTTVFRERIFDYQKFLVAYGESGSIKDWFLDKLLAAVKKSTVAVTNEVLDKLSEKVDIKLKKEVKADRHVISTQAISGAGAKETSGAGSLAVSVVNLTTDAKIAAGKGAVTITDTNGALNVNAGEKRRIRTVASAAVDERGDADANSGAGSAEDKDSQGSDKGQNTISYNHMTIMTDVGGSAEFDPTRSDDQPLLWVNVEPGYKLPENMKCKRLYNAITGDTVEDELEIHDNGNGEYFIVPFEGKDQDEAQERPISINIEFEEDLHSIKAPEVLGGGIPAGAVTVSVDDRKVENNVLKARAGEFVKVTTKKIEGKKVTKIGYEYTDADGNKQEVTCDVIGSSNKDETVYLIKMPDAEITSILVQYEDGVDDTGDKDGARRSIGVGAAGAFTYGNSKVNANIGTRGNKDTGITAGSITVKASSDHDEYNYSAAGTDPFKGVSDDVKKEGYDVSVALDLMFNNINASIDEGSTVLTTGADTKGDLSVTAHETSSSDTRASAFATGSNTIVGASAAVNVSTSDIKAEMKSSAKVAGEAKVSADSTAKDTTWSIATAFGADVQKALNKFADAATTVEKGVNSLTTGSLFDKWTSEKRKENKTAKKVNSALNKKKAQDGDDARDGLPLSTNVLRSQGTQMGDDGGAGEAADEAAQNANQAADRNDLAGQKKKKKEDKWQVAATVGFTWAEHNTAATITGNIVSGKDLTASAINHGNFNTRSTAAAMSLAAKGKDGGSTIAGAGAISVNNNKATVDTRGSLTSREGNLKVASDLTLNQEEEFLGKLGAQALSGAGSGKETDWTVGGAVAAIKSRSEARARSTGLTEGAPFTLSGDEVSVTATDKTKLALRAGGISGSKGSNIGIGASLAVIWSNNDVKAELGDNASVTGRSFTLSADKKSVSKDDYKFPLKWRDLITSTQMKDEDKENLQTGIFNINKKKGSLTYDVEVNADTYRLMKAFDALNFLSSTNYYTEAIAGSLVTGGDSNKLNGAGSFSIVHAANTILTTLGQNANIILDTARKAGDAVVSANSGTNARMLGGALSAGKANKAAGITVTYMQDTDDVQVQVKDHVKIAAGKGIAVKASADTEAEAYNGAVAVNVAENSDFSVGGGLNIIRLNNNAKTVVGTNADFAATEKLTVSSGAVNNMSLVSGSLAGSRDGAAAGGTVAFISDNTAATIDIGKNHLLKGKQGVDILSDTSSKLLSVIASISAAAGADDKAYAGSIDLIKSGTKANVNLDGGEKGHGIFADNGSVLIKGNGETRAINVTVAAAGSVASAIGLSANINWFDRETKVDVKGGDDYEIKAAKDVSVLTNGVDLTILAALALTGSFRGNTLTGNVPVVKSTNTVKTNIAAGKINAGGEAAFSSHITDRTFAIAGSIALANSGNSLGATGMGMYKSNEVTTDLGRSVVTADGSAGTLAGTIFGSPSFKGVYVGATQEDTAIMGAAGVALSFKTGVSGNLNVFWNESIIKSDASKASITARTGEVKLEAADETLDWVIAGGLSVGLNVGGGGTLVGVYGYKQVDAFAGKMTAQKDVTVRAYNHDDINMLAVSGGGGKDMAVQIGTAVQILSSKVHARAYEDIESEGGKAAVTAENKTDLINAAASVAGSVTMSVSPVVTLTWFEGETEAAAFKKVKAAQDILVEAIANKDIDQYTAGVAIAVGEGVGFSGGLTFMYAKDSSAARADAASDLSSTKGNISVRSTGDFKEKALAGTVSGSGGAAIGVNAVVGIMKSKVEAEIAGKAKAKDVSVNARAERDVLNVAVDAGFGLTAAAGATVMAFFAGTDKISQDVADGLLYGNAEKRDKEHQVLDARKIIQSANDLGLKTGSINLEKALEGDGVYDSKISVKDPGASSNPDDVKNSINDPTENKKSSENEPSDMVLARIAATAAVTAEGDVNVAAAQPTKADLYAAILKISGTASLGASVAYLKTASNVLATSQGSITSAGGKVNVKAVSEAANVDITKDADEQERMNSIREKAGKDAFAKLNPSERSIRAVSAGVFGSAFLGAGAAVAVVRTDNRTEAAIGGTVTEAGAVNVHADSVYSNVLAATLSVGVGQAVLNGSVGVALSDGEVSSRIRSGSSVISDNRPLSVNVTTNSVMHVNAMAADMAGALGGLNTGVAYAKNNITQTTSIDRGVTIKGSAAGTETVPAVNASSVSGTDSKEGKPGVNVSAVSDTTADTTLLEVFLGLGTVNVGGSMAYIKPTVHTTIGVNGSGKTVINVPDAPVKVGNIITSTASPSKLSVGAGIGIVAMGISVMEAVNETEATAKTANLDLTSESLTVSSALKAEGTSSIRQANISGIGAGVSSTHVDLNAHNTAAVDTTGGSITTTKGVRIDTGDKKTSQTKGTAEGSSFAMGLLAVGVNVAEVINRTSNIASLTGSGKVNTGTAIEVETIGTAKAKSDMGGTTVALIGAQANKGSAPVSKVVNEAVNKATVDLTGALTSNLNVKSDLEAETTAVMDAFGLTVLEIVPAKTQAIGNTASLVDIRLDKTGTTKVDINAENHGKNTVSATTGESGVHTVAVMLLDAIAESTDVYRTTINLGDGRFRLNGLNARTEYETSVSSSVTPAGGGFSANVVAGTNNDSKATNRSYAGTFLNLSGGIVQAAKDINVQTIGSAEAKAEGKTGVLELTAVSAGPTDAVADLSASQAAEINLKEGEIRNTGGNLFLDSTVKKALAEAAVGSMGTSGSGGFDLNVFAAKPFTAEASDRMNSTASIKGSSKYTDGITAKEIHIGSGAGKDAITKAKASSASNVGLSIATFGALKAEAFAAEKTYTKVQGVELNATAGAAEIISRGNAEAESSSTAPGTISPVSVQSVSTVSRVGKNSERQTVNTLIGDLTGITGKTVSIKAENSGYSHGKLEKNVILSMMEIPNSNQTTESYYDTGVFIGKQSEIVAKDTMDIQTKTSPKTDSIVDVKEFLTAINVSDMYGRSIIDETNTLSIGDTAVLEAANRLNIQAKSSADANVRTAMDGGYKTLGGATEVHAENSITRKLNLTVGRSAVLTSAKGEINIESISGEEDKIQTIADINGSGTFHVGNDAYATTNLNSDNTVRVGEKTRIQAAKDINIKAVSTSKNGTANGNYTYSVVKGGSLTVDPDAVSTLNANLLSNVFINRGLSSGNTNIESSRGKIFLYAGNEGMVSEVKSNADGGAFAGGAKAVSSLAGKVGNAVWVDNADLTAGDSIIFKANNGEEKRAKINLYALGEMYAAFGSANAVADLGGTWTNQVSSYNTKKVGITAPSFIHIAKDPDTSVDKSVNGVKNYGGIVGGSGESNSTWSRGWACDWCTPFKGTRDIVDETDYYTSQEKKLKAAFEKALDAMNEIQKMADNVKETGVVKARYGEEEEIPAGEIFVLSLQTILGKDVRLDMQDLVRYRVWNNTAVSMDIYLLPNSAHLAAGANSRLLYVTDVIKGDALGDGNSYIVDVITALTPGAFENAVIPIGSKGQLNMRSGEFNIPAYSDLELYLDEVSSAWLVENIQSGMIRTMFADQEQINEMALNETAMPQGEILEGLSKEDSVRTLDEKDAQKLEFYWVGKTADEAADPDEPLYFLTVDPETDEVDAFRTSLNMMNDEEGMKVIDSSLYLFRDTNADARGEEQYNMLFFDTLEKEPRSIIKLITNVLGNRDMETPRTLRIILREFALDGADLPGRSISGHLFAMNDGSDGSVSMFDGFYKAAFDGDVFDSAYTRIEGISTGENRFTIKAGQSIWPEWTSDDTAEDVEGKRFRMEEDEWQQETSESSAA